MYFLKYITSLFEMYPVKPIKILLVRNKEAQTMKVYINIVGSVATLVVATEHYIHTIIYIGL